jgi:serine/threonine protein phosphatase PrpC
VTINLEVCGQTDVGGVRRKNEDAFIVADLTGGNLLPERQVGRFEIGERGVLMAVSDGVGGYHAGEVASALVVESIRRSLAAGGDQQPDALLEEAALRANRDVWREAHCPGREEMGATLTALYMRGPVAHIAEVGDSRAYLLRGGKIRQVTHDQSYVQFLVDSGVMSPEAAQSSERRHVILQAVGLDPRLSVALGRLELRQRDCLILCTDGLTTKVGAAQIRETVLGSTGLDTACARLVDLANARGGEDNITVIVAGVSGDLPPLAPRESLSETFSVIKEFDAWSRPA